MAVVAVAQAAPVATTIASANKDDPDGILASVSGMMDSDMIAGTSTEQVPTSGTKCSVGCGVGIGIGCLAGLVLLVFIFIMARRHKRRLHNLWLHRRWQARQKDLPDKPVPAPPPPTKT
ncbi:hypothetical protein GGI26_005577 [Coemansia sp. RSA 1358]|nr:hypothetical protein BX070DRAFT_251300 [Coemansia spiralis]KAJ2619767.1 hypothetical protein GGI26_005577 [Coemansia sp. RSA 1358]